MHNLIEDDQVKIAIQSFVTEKMSQTMSALNKVESALLRIVRKIIVIHAYPRLREEISKKLDTLPEIERFVNRPTVQQYTFANELRLHDQYFSILSKLSEEQLNILSPKLLEYEKVLMKISSRRGSIYLVEIRRLTDWNGTVQMTKSIR